MPPVEATEATSEGPEIAAPAMSVAVAEPPAAAIPIAAPELVAVAAPPAPAPSAIPRIEVTPMALESLTPLLEQAGLMLVQTAPDKHAEVQQRIAAEPKPIRVPRERPVQPPIDTGPLIQVETRRRESQPMQSA